MNTRKLVAAGVTITLALGGAVLGVTSASADESNPEVASSLVTSENTTSPTTPTSSEAPTSQETTVPGPTIPVETAATQPGDAPVTVEAVTEPSQAPDSSPSMTPMTENSSATSPSTPATTVPSPTSTRYVLAVWENEAGSPKFPQKLVTSYKTSDTNVKVLAQYAINCGTFYQSDLYADDDRTAALVAKGVLNGGDESWPKGEPQRYDTFTTEKCVSVPQIQDYVKCDGAAFVLDNTGSNQAVVYTINGLKISVPKGQAFHTDAEGAPLIQPVNGEYVVTAADRTWTFKAPISQSENNTAPCYVAPLPEEPTTPEEPGVPEEPAVPEIPVETVSETVTDTVIPVDTAVIQPVETAQVEKSETDSLAFTGSESISAAVLAGLALLAAGGYLISRKRRV